MSLPSMSIINFSRLREQAVLEGIRTVNRQVQEDFLPIWGNGRVLQLHAAAFDPAKPETLAEEPVRGESVLYIVDEPSLENALGFHDLNTRDFPVGFVFVLDPNDWTTTLSHEALELIIDPTVNLFAPGPDPRNPQNVVLHAYEVCDAVERSSYEIDGVRVSNFLTQSYFTVGEAAGSRNDFLGVGVKSFGVTRGSHIDFFDLNAGTFVTFVGQEGAPSSLQARRADAFEHPKPARPDKRMNQILRDYQSKPSTDKCDRLPELGGITREARYRQAALRMEKTLKR
jgi:hypothetical protein